MQFLIVLAKGSSPYANFVIHIRQILCKVFLILLLSKFLTHRNFTSHVK